MLCRIENVQKTVGELAELGFSVAWGSAPDTAHNALVWFEEGPFLEFFTFPSALRLLRWPVAARFGRGMGDRFARWARADGGWRDVALETDDLDLTATRDRLVGSGLGVSRIFRNGRTRPDGQRVDYQFMSPRPAVLPFVVSSYDPPQRPAKITHPNGATAVWAVHYGIRPEHRADYDRLIGEDPWLRPRAATTTGVLEVELAGLTTPLSLTSGLHLVPAPPKEPQL
ncbi:VOC family protein [Saccharopolyspora spinosa]|uniref:VOC family protein n=1 Tax=Saccharopolyspora spinosa TaxID=60894 RepID=UPI000237A135|nr:VOC family protein [Saccharopolyspora spinosa]